MRPSELTVDLPVEGHLPSLDGATGWLNSEPLATESLRGKVVLIDFWTYTCINWLRTLSYIRAWGKKYEDQGLVVVGVHTPEFPFERDLDNVRDAAKEMAVRYPIALDSKYRIWRAFSNQYWPAAYIAGKDQPTILTPAVTVVLTTNSIGSSVTGAYRPRPVFTNQVVTRANAITASN